MFDAYELLGIPSTGFDSKQFATSWLLPPISLAIVRAVLSVYCFTTIFYSWAWFGTHQVTFHLQDIDIPAITFTIGTEAIRRSFSYFTYLSYWGLAFYFFFASTHTFVFAIRRCTWLHDWPRPLQALHSIFYSSIVCIPFLVTTIYWGSMWVGPWFTHDFDSWSAVSIHALNSVFALFEILVTQTAPLPWLHLGGLLLIMSLYLGVAYLTKIVEGVYIYLWLDPEVGLMKIIAHLVGYAAAMVVIFNMVRGLIWLRCAFTKKCTHTPDPDEIDPRKSCGSSDITLRMYKDLEMQRTPVCWDTVSVYGETTHLVDVRRPEPAFRQHPRRSSSYHVRNFARPESVDTMSPRLSGFWI